MVQNKGESTTKTPVQALQVEQLESQFDEDVESVPLDTILTLEEIKELEAKNLAVKMPHDDDGSGNDEDDDDSVEDDSELIYDNLSLISLNQLQHPHWYNG